MTQIAAFIRKDHPEDRVQKIAVENYGYTKTMPEIGGTILKLETRELVLSIYVDHATLSELHMRIGEHLIGSE